MSLTYARAKELLSYDPRTGVLTWKVTRAKARVGARAGTIDHYGHRTLGIDGKKYRAARVAFLLMEKRWPTALIDHENTDPADDRWDNLREANKAQNAINTKCRSDNPTGLKGVFINRGSTKNRYAARLSKKHLGCFSTAAKAHAAYLSAAREQFGVFVRTK